MEGRVLKQHAGPSGGRHAAQGRLPDHPAALRGQGAGQHARQGGLPDAVGSHQPDKLAGVQLQVDVLQDGPPIIACCYPLHADQWGLRARRRHDPCRRQKIAVRAHRVPWVAQTQAPQEGFIPKDLRRCTIRDDLAAFHEQGPVCDLDERVQTVLKDKDGHPVVGMEPAQCLPQ